MDQFIQRRLSDVRFSNQLRRVDAPDTSWFNAGQRYTVSHHTFATSEPSQAADKEGKKKRKKKKRKTEADGESATSDGTDSGRCWSNYEEDPDKEPYSKDSCRRKKK